MRQLSIGLPKVDHFVEAGYEITTPRRLAIGNKI